MKKNIRVPCAALLLSAFILQTASAQNNFEKGIIPDEKEPSISAVKEVSEGSAKIGEETLLSEDQDKSAILVTKGASLKAKGTSVEKKSGNSSNEAQSNFYGLNAAIVVKKASSLVLEGVTISSNAEGANALFATGKSSVKAKNIKIRTKKNSSRGLDATYGGNIHAQNVDIETEGEHSAAFATDRGEGNVNVEGGSAHTRGEGSPVVYSTGNISVKNIRGSAKSSEIAVVEGKNSASLEGCTFFGGSQSRSPRAVMLYQSMSGDARKGNASMSIKNCSLFNSGTGPFFYVTNTSASLLMENTKLESKGSELLHVSGNNSERGWGKKGANGGKLNFLAVKQNLSGDIFCDAISSLTLTLSKGSSYSGTINALDAGKVNLVLDKKSTLTLTGDSFVNAIVNEDSSFKNISSKGYTLFYNKNAGENAYLKGATILLQGGGKLVAVEAGEKKLLDSDEKSPDEGLPLVKNYEGKISLQEDGSLLLVTETKEWKLLVWEDKGPGNKKDQRPEGMKNGMPGEKPNGKPMGNPPEGFAPDGKRPDLPPKNEMGEKGGIRGEPGLPPKTVSLEELKKFDGKTVTVKAFEKDDELIVFEVKEK